MDARSTMIAKPMIALGFYLSKFVETTSVNPRKEGVPVTVTANRYTGKVDTRE